MFLSVYYKDSILILSGWFSQLFYLQSIVTRGTVADGEAAANEVVLDVDHDQARHRSNNLEKIVICNFVVEQTQFFLSWYHFPFCLNVNFKSLTVFRALSNNIRLTYKINFIGAPPKHQLLEHRLPKNRLLQHRVSNTSSVKNTDCLKHQLKSFQIFF